MIVSIEAKNQTNFIFHLSNDGKTFEFVALLTCNGAGIGETGFQIKNGWLILLLPFHTITLCSQHGYIIHSEVAILHLFYLSGFIDPATLHSRVEKETIWKCRSQTQAARLESKWSFHYAMASRAEVAVLFIKQNQAMKINRINLWHSKFISFVYLSIFTKNKCWSKLNRNFERFRTQSSNSTCFD